MVYERVASHVGDIIRAHDPWTSDGMAKIWTVLVLRKYSKVIELWPKIVAAPMIADVGRRDERALGREFPRHGPDAARRAKLAEKVALIKSLPMEAAERVHKLMLELSSDATRAGKIAKEIVRSGQV